MHLCSVFDPGSIHFYFLCCLKRCNTEEPLQILKSGTELSRWLCISCIEIPGKFINDLMPVWFKVLQLYVMIYLSLYILEW